ncbi:DEAD/DEAH box helicase [Microbacterium aurum]
MAAQRNHHLCWRLGAAGIAQRGASMPFPRPKPVLAATATPADMYSELPPRPDAVPGLWAHQSEMLRTFAEHDDKPDVALELPTGTGKTLTGILLAEWTRRKRRARVLYACTTQQLARQVVAAASRETIGTALLIGPHDQWAESDRNAYEAGEAIGVTTYSSVFNSNPHLKVADLILFDDAHAGEQYVGEKYGVVINRRISKDAYDAVLGAVAGALDGVFLERLRASDPDPTVSGDIRMVLPLRQPGMVALLDAALSKLGKPHRYDFAMIRAGLSSCLVYVTYAGITVRPYLPPTHQNQLFNGARQRVFLSATLGEGGELERAFGRSEIFRLEQPRTSPRRGRRFFVFPEFVADADATDLARKIVRQTGKALVLAPRKSLAMDDARALAQPGWPVLDVDDVKDGMKPFAKLKNGVCGLAARYDGLDLPGNECRTVALDGVPDQDNLQERFLASRARAGNAIAARVRTRVIQGAGRCTRGPRDTAIVLILGGELSRYLSRPEVIGALEPELQAELTFGRQSSQEFNADEVMENVRAFLDQEKGDTWREEAEPSLADFRRVADQILPEGTSALAACVADEVHAWAAAFAGAWDVAAQHAHEIARVVGSGGASTAGYRAFWMYLEAAWSDEAAERQKDAGGRAAARSLVRQAEKVMTLGSWIRQMAPFPAMEREALSATDAVAVKTLATRLEAGVNQGKVRRQIGEVQSGLAERSPSKYEPALTQLGVLLGANSFKPHGKGRCDSVWLWGNELWLALEAKSDHEPTGVVADKEVRQANDQLRKLASDQGVEVAPAESATVIISPKPGIDRDGIKGAEAHVHFVAPALIAEVAYDTATCGRNCSPNPPGARCRR